jgi:RNA polymerase sigma-70 factor (ECF subfamily)
MADDPVAHLLSPAFTARLRAGDREAFEQLFRGFYSRLADYACSLLASADAAEDAVQDVFVAVWDGRERLPEGGRLVGYLYRSVRNRALNQIRARRTAARWLAAVEPDPAISPEAELVLEDRELEQAYRAALEEVSPRGREVFLLSRDHGLSYPQIAELLGISVKTVETLMGRVLRALRARLLPRLDRRP